MKLKIYSLNGTKKATGSFRLTKEKQTWFGAKTEKNWYTITINDYVVKNFGDVEIYDLTVHLMGTQKKDGKVFVPKFEVIL